MGKGGGFGASGDVEFGEDVGDVDAGGFGADVEAGGDLAGGVAFGDEGEYFAFAVGEPEPVLWLGFGFVGCGG